MNPAGTKAGGGSAKRSWTWSGCSFWNAADPAKLGWRFNGPENAAREAAMARRLIQAGPVAVAVLGQAHDLADEIKAACAACRVEVVRTETTDLPSR